MKVLSFVFVFSIHIHLNPRLVLVVLVAVEDARVTLSERTNYLLKKHVSYLLSLGTTDASNASCVMEPASVWQ